VRGGASEWRPEGVQARAWTRSTRGDDDRTEEGRRNEEGATEVEDKGKQDISPSFFTPIHLQVGLIWLWAYKMAWFKQLQSCNGTHVVN
jgi:hypothetical protein